MDVRRPPLLPAQAGRCPWCGEAIEPRRKKNGELHGAQPGWHRRCAAEWRMCFSASAWLDEIAQRDGMKCRSCGANPGKWKRGGEALPALWLQKPDSIWGGRFSMVKWMTALVVDHVVPLWKVAHLEQPLRRRYFLAENMQLLCDDPCHKRKTAAEAAERAHLERLRNPKAKGEDPKPMGHRPASVRDLFDWRP